MAIKGDSLVEQLLNYAKKGLFVNSAERELVKRAAMRIQTLQAEKYLLREQAPVAPSEMDVSPILMEYRCGACRCLVGAESAIRNDVGFRHAYCPECGKKVLWHG
jgi:DNA-directed RNA polymerase subunit RPC12/RpoP